MSMVQYFGIDTIKTDTGEIPGIKRMFDIALQLKDSIMLHGGPGIGKSQAVHQWNAAKAKADPTWNPVVCDVRLSMKEPVDLIGIPIPQVNINGEHETVWATPKMWPKENDKYKGGIILLDEINQGQPNILNAAFQLIQDRALGDYKVPEGYVIIAACNPAIYNSSVSDLSLPLCNRFSHFNIRPDFNSWLNYRLNNGGNPDVISFLRTQDQNLLFDAKSFESRTGSLEDGDFTDMIPTPRSWEVIERLLDLPEFTMQEKMYYATGRLGLATAIKFFDYLNEKDKYQNWQEILIKGLNFKHEDAEYFYVTQTNCISAISNCMDKETCKEYITNFLNAIRKLSKPTLKITSLKQLIDIQRLTKDGLFNIVKDAPDLLNLILDINLGE